MQYSYATTAERRRIYAELIRDIDRGDKFGMCIRAAKMMGMALTASLTLLPELLKQAPEKHWCRGLWYFIDEYGMQKRKQALLKAIEICDIQLKQNES